MTIHGATAKTLASAVLILTVGLAVRVERLPRPGFPIDMLQHAHWAFVASQERGLAGLYDVSEVHGRRSRLCNYPPVFLLCLRGVAEVYPWFSGRSWDAQVVDAFARRAHTDDGRSVHDLAPHAVKSAIVLLKMPATLADLATAVLIYLLLRRRLSNVFALIIGLFYVVHPAVVLNSAVWGQVDSIHTLWMFLALDAARRRRPRAMTAWGALAVLTKAQSLLLWPIWLMVLLFGFGRVQPGPVVRRLGACALVALLVTAAVLLPFGAEGVSGVADAYTKAVGFYPVVHLNGFSAWFLINPLDAPRLDDVSRYQRDDRPWLAGLSPRHIGMLAYWAVAFAVAAILWHRRCDDVALRWAARVLPLAFFVLPTQMHERYLFPVIALWAWAAMPTPRWWGGWCAVGLCAALNQMWVFAGEPTGFVERALAARMHEPWLGQPPGVWCAIVLAGLLLLSFFEMIWSRRGSSVQTSAA
jgi:hypothetical protein